MNNSNQKKILALLPGACEEFSDCPPLGFDVLYRDGQVAEEIRKAESDSQRRTPASSLHEMATRECARKWAKRSRVLAPSVAVDELCAAGLVSLKVWYVVCGEVERPVLIRDTPGII